MPSRDLAISDPGIHPGVDTEPKCTNTGAMLTCLENAFIEQLPNSVLVLGEANSSLAAVISVVTLHWPYVYLDARSRLQKPVLLLAPLRAVAMVQECTVRPGAGSIVLHNPQSYPDSVSAEKSCAGIITVSEDSQKEASILRVPRTTVRTEREWVEILGLGWHQLAILVDEILAAATRLQSQPTDATPYGGGHDTERVIAALRT